MKKYSLIILFSFFFLINNVYAEYYLIPNSFELDREDSQLNPDFDFDGVNDGIMTSIKTLNGSSNTWYSFEFDLDGSNCASNIDSTECFNTIHAIEDGGKSNTIYGSFQMCVSKPQFHWEINWSTCNNNCLKKSQDLVIINKSYQNCTLGLYDTETGTNMTNDGYLVTVYFDIAKWQYIEGAYSGLVNGRIYLYNDSDSILYYKFVNNVLLSDRNMSSFESGYGIFNHDYSNPDIGGETFLNDGTCFFSYNKMNNYSYSNNWNRQTSTLTFNNNLPYEKLPGSNNLFDGELELGSYNGNTGDKISTSDTYRNKNIIKVEPNTTYTFSINGTSQKYVIYYYDSSKSFIGVDTSLLLGTFTTPNNCYFINFRSFGSDFTNNFESLNIMLNKGTSVLPYEPGGGYYVSYTNLQAEMAIFHYYATNLYQPGNIYIYYDNYDNDYELIDMVNCSNSYVCKYENIYSFSHLSNILNPSKDWVNNIKIYWTGNESIYFEKPYIYDLYDVPGRATWKEYYMPAGTYICSNNENGTYYNAQNKEVYYNPDKPPKIVSSNPNGQSQNIFGIEVNFYGLSGLFNIPIQIINNIKNGSYNNCQPLDIPFPGFPDKHLYMPCMTNYVYNRYPVLLSMYRVIIYGVISLRVGIGTLKYIKKWYDGTIESGD